MLDFFKSIPSKITSWYDKKKEEEKQELGQFKYLSKPETKPSQVFEIKEQRNNTSYNPLTKSFGNEVTETKKTNVDIFGNTKESAPEFTLFDRIKNEVKKLDVKFDSKTGTIQYPAEKVSSSFREISESQQKQKPFIRDYTNEEIKNSPPSKLFQYAEDSVYKIAENMGRILTKYHNEIKEGSNPIEAIYQATKRETINSPLFGKMPVLDSELADWMDYHVGAYKQAVELGQSPEQARQTARKMSGEKADQMVANFYSRVMLNVGKFGPTEISKLPKIEQIDLIKTQARQYFKKEAGIDINKASADELKKAFNNLAFKYHPDRAAHTGITSGDKFVELNNFYTIAKDAKGAFADNKTIMDWFKNWWSNFAKTTSQPKPGEIKRIGDTGIEKGVAVVSGVTKDITAPIIDQAKELFQKIDQGKINEAAKLDIAKDITKEEFVDLMVRNDFERDPFYKDIPEDKKEVFIQEQIEQYGKGWGEQFDKLQKSLPKETTIKAPVETPVKAETTPTEAKTTPQKDAPQDLMEEARKYKTAEDFVKAHENILPKEYSVQFTKLPKSFGYKDGGSMILFKGDEKIATAKIDFVKGKMVVNEIGTIGGIKGTGEGTLLLKYIEQQAKEKGAQEILAEVVLPESVGYWEKQGYSAVGEEYGSPIMSKSLKTKSQLTDIWNKAQEQIAEKPKGKEIKPAQPIKGKVTGIQEKPTKVTKKAIIETIKPLSQKITKGVDYLNKLVLRKGKEAVSNYETMRKYMFRDLRNLGFTNKEIGRHFSTLLRAKTPEQAELVKGEVIKKLLETQNKIAKMKLIDSIKSIHKSLKKAKLGQKAEEIFKEINLMPKVKSDKSLAKTKEKILLQLKDQSVWTGEPIKPEDLDFLDKMKSLNDLSLRELAEVRDSLKGLNASLDYSENITIGNKKYSRKELNTKISMELEYSKNVWGEEKRLSDLTTKDKIKNIIKKPTNWIADLNKNNLSYVSTLFPAADKEDIVQYIREMFINPNPDINVVGKFLGSYILDGAFGWAENKAVGLKLGMVDFFHRLKLSASDSYMTSNKPTITKYKLESGKILPLTVTQKVEIAYQARNQKARAHLLNEEGGVAISRNPFDKGALYDTYRLTARDLYKIQSSLDARENNMVKEIESYMKELGVSIDEVSEMMLGRKIATESNYMRMKVLRDKDVVVDDATQAMNRNKEGDFIVSPSSRISKTRTGSGKGSLIIGGFDKVTLTYARDAIDYISMEHPIKEAQKFLSDHEKGIKEIKGGSKIYKKINKFVKDMRGTAYDEQEADKLLKAMLSSAREAIMMLNISMTLAQPMSYVLATYYVDGKYLLQGLGKTFSRDTIIKMKKYSAVARDRIENKTFNFEMATINDKAPDLLDTKGPLKVLRGGLMKPISAADIKTVALIWESIEKKVRAESPNMSEEDVMKTTALVWEEVIKTTQPSTHRSARSEIGRSANVGWKLATLFTGVRNKTFNLLDQAFNRFWRSKRTKKDYAKLAGIVVAIGVLVSYINANRQALVRWLFRRQKTTPKQFVQDMILTNLGNMYFLGDFAASFRSKTESSIYAGWEYTMLPLQLVNTAISSAVILEDLINAESDEVYTSGKYAGELKRKVLAERALKTITPLIDTMARLPVSNVTRLSDAYKNWMEIKPTDEVMSGGTPARSITPRITAPRPAPRPRPSPRPTPRPGR